MSRVKSGDTKPEIIVRKLLHGMGFRFRLHVKKLPGCPDIVLPKHKKIIFVHGCFWHGHQGCARAKRPETNIEFWDKKIFRNIERDEKNLLSLTELGWTTLIVWECEIRKSELLIEKITKFMQEK